MDTTTRFIPPLFVIKFIRIFLAVLIVIGIVLICTQGLWVPKLVNQILIWQGLSTVNTY